MIGETDFTNIFKITGNSEINKQVYIEAKATNKVNTTVFKITSSINNEEFSTYVKTCYKMYVQNLTNFTIGDVLIWLDTFNNLQDKTQEKIENISINGNGISLNKTFEPDEENGFTFKFSVNGLESYEKGEIIIYTTIPTSAMQVNTEFDTKVSMNRKDIIYDIPSTK